MLENVGGYRSPPGRLGFFEVWLSGNAAPLRLCTLQLQAVATRREPAGDRASRTEREVRLLQETLVLYQAPGTVTLLRDDALTLTLPSKFIFNLRSHRLSLTHKRAPMP
jgi:hypothetical protein